MTRLLVPDGFSMSFYPQDDEDLMDAQLMKKNKRCCIDDTRGTRGLVAPQNQLCIYPHLGKLYSVLLDDIHVRYEPTNLYPDIQRMWQPRIAHDLLSESIRLNLWMNEEE